MAYESNLPEELILRDHLARDRTKLANERTLLAYIRTAFMLFVAGPATLKVFNDTPSVMFTAWLFIAVGVLVGIFGIWRFVSMRRRIDQRRIRGGTPEARSDRSRAEDPSR
jgi:putative membrane protein